ncbi:Hypothetical predicted protein, partial [Olea europaea subsp. europaea]
MDYESCVGTEDQQQKEILETSFDADLPESSFEFVQTLQSRPKRDVFASEIRIPSMTSPEIIRRENSTKFAQKDDQGSYSKDQEKSVIPVTYGERGRDKT